VTPIAAGRRDVVVVGAGPAGMAAALSAAACGRRVTLVSDGQLLGDGLQGAYKSKAMWELARDRMTARRQGFGYAPAAAAVRFDEIHEQLECGVAELCEMYAHYLDINHVELILARARFVDPHTIEAGRARIEADAFIVATGARPRGLPGVTIDGRAIMTTQHIVDVAENFEKLLIVGAGVSGCEFASIFAALGVDVTLLDSAPCLLNNEDADLSALITESYRRSGIDVRFSARTQSMERIGGHIKTTLADGSVILSDRVLLSIGREGMTSDLGLEAAGVTVERGGVVAVNDCLQTNVPHIYAVGDVGVRNTPLDMALVHIADAEGRMAVEHLCGKPISIHPEYVPFIIFTMPMIAGAGLTETEARRRHGAVRVAKFLNARNHRYHAMRSFEGFVKLIVGPDGDDRILGVRAIGEQADNIIGTVAVMIDNGIPYTYLLDALQAHPSLGESLQNAARVLGGLLPPAL
jgi:dihydrolipoamide dehydrogenase